MTTSSSGDGRAQEPFARWYLVLLLLVTYTAGHAESTVTCNNRSSSCQNGTCDEELPCINGHCDESGQCICRPCYKGSSCTTYVDSYGPHFTAPEATVIVEHNQTGVIFVATAVDDDHEIICSDNFENDCLCGVIHYLIDDNSTDAESSPFKINRDTGKLTLRQDILLDPGQQYQVQIIATNGNESPAMDPLYIDVMSLTVLIMPNTVQEGLVFDSFNDDIYNENMEYIRFQETFPESITYLNTGNQNVARNRHIETFPEYISHFEMEHQALSREKRNALSELVTYPALVDEVEELIRNKRDETFPEYISHFEMEHQALSREKRNALSELVTYPALVDEVEELIRNKRDATGSTSNKTQLTLTMDSGPTMDELGSNGTLRPGDKLSYTLTVALPEISSDNTMDMKIEVFLMDAVTDIPSFALCNLRVFSIGDQITFDNTPDKLITQRMNQDYLTFYDRAVIDFGNVTNNASVGSSDYADSTITIKFDAILIRNMDYDNATAMVTAGVEYDKESFAWIGQAFHNYSMDVLNYKYNITLEAQQDIAENSGEGFIVKAYITNPFEKLTLHLYTADNIVDKFTITSLFVKYKGANWACVEEIFYNNTLYPSVTERTIHRAILQVQLINCGSIGDADHDNAVTNDTNLLELGFVVYAVDAKNAETISIGANILIGDSSIWTAVVDLATVPISIDEDTVTYTLEKRISSNQVPDNGAATWVIKAELPRNKDAKIKCDATGTSETSVCGVMYGDIGSNIAYLPELSDHVTITDDGTTSWAFDTGTVKTLDFGNCTCLNKMEFEVSVRYSTSTRDPVTVICGSDTITLNGISAMSNSSDDIAAFVMSMSEDATWYAGSQAGIQLRLSIPGGLAYSPLTLELSGDLTSKSYGSRICSARLVSAGRGVPCSYGIINKINQNLIKRESLSGSLLKDSGLMELGSTCGISRNNISSASNDNDLFFEIIYELPINETVSDEDTYMLSTGLLLSGNQVWTGWKNFTISSSGPTYDSSKKPIFDYLDPPSTNISIGIPTKLTVVLKTHPGSVGTYTIKVTSDAPDKLGICRLSILAVGTNYGCVDSDPYGKSNHTNQHQTIIHDPGDWGKEATLTLGTLRNLAKGEMDASNSADADTILLAVFVRGIIGGNANLSFELDNSGNLETKSISFSIDLAPLKLNKTITAGDMQLSGTTWHGEGEYEAYKGVMKVTELTISVPIGYTNKVKLTFTNEFPKDLTLSFAQVTKVGINIPCLLPFNIISTVTSENPFILELDLREVCHFPLSDDAEENNVVVRLGQTFFEDTSSDKLRSSSNAEIKIQLTEDSGSQVTLPSFNITKREDSLEKEVNVSDGMKLELISNETTIVEPGDRLYVGVKFTVPPDLTVPMEIGMMTPSDGGRAYATVHGFRFDTEIAGKNLGTLLKDTFLYDPIITHSSLNGAMIHPTQTDTLVANLKYITNAAISYLQKNPKVEDDQMYIEADILIADHVNASDGDQINIAFSVQAGNFIFIIEKTLTLSKVGNLEISVLGNFGLSSGTPSDEFKKLDKIHITARLWHEADISRQEANDAVVRVFFPKYVHYINSDTYSSNMSINFTNKHYLDFGIDYLFFADFFELNFTVTVDPYDKLPKGLGIINATSIMRFVCKTDIQQPDNLRYCGKTYFFKYFVDTSDCQVDLQVNNTFEDCRFSASTAINELAGPANAAKGDGWSPAMRPGTMNNYITVDFKKMTRVTKISFTNVNNDSHIDTFKIQYSYSGMLFKDACDINITVDNLGDAQLPSQCIIEARFARIIILSTNDSSTKLTVKFSWFGCPIDPTDVDETCVYNLLTSYTDKVKQAKPWRHAAYDDVNKIFYFCDYSLKKERVACFSSDDNGLSWNSLPTYIGYLLGSVDGFMYAKDRKDSAIVKSSNGVLWAIVDEKMYMNVTITNDPLPIPVTKNVEVAISDWTADFTGLKLKGTYKVKWDTYDGI